MACRWLPALIVAMWTVASGAAEEWHIVPEEESRALHKAAEGALEAQWERSRRGWCRAILDHYGDQQQFTLWWDEDKRGLEVEKVTLGEERDPRIRAPELHVAVYLPTEQWIYSPRFHHCHGFGGRQAQRLPGEFEIHPHKIWLAMLGGQTPRFVHLHWLRAANTGDRRLHVSRDDGGLVSFDTRQMRLVLDPQRGFSPVRAEFQTKLDEDSHPELMLPTREDYELAQDRHGEWYCRQMIRTSWPRGGQGEPGISRSAMIVEYDSRPAPSLLRLSFEALALPQGTSVQAKIPSRPARWIVGREREGEQALTEERFRELGRALRARGFAEEDAP